MSAALPVAMASRWTAGEIDNLRTFIREELSYMLSESSPNYDSNLELLSGAEAMKIWCASFTHKSITASASENYESLETLGDAYLASLFYSYVDREKISRKIDITQSYYTELKRYWLSKAQLAIFSEKAGFPNYIKFEAVVMEAPDKSMKEDVFEAFFGAIITLGDRLITPGAGYILALSYFPTIMQGIDIFLAEEMIFPVKTKLKEIFEGMLWGEVQYVTSSGYQGEVRVTIKDGNGNPLAIELGADATEAQNRAAYSAIKKLANQAVPITKDSLAKNRAPDFQIEALKSRIMKFLKTRGNYGGLETTSLHKKRDPGTGTVYLIELYVIQDYETANAMRVALGTGLSSGRTPSYRNAVIEACNNYIALHRIK